MSIIRHSNYSLEYVTDDDHSWLVELHNDPLVLRNITDSNPITLDSHLKWWNSLNQNKEKRHLFCVNGERVGFTKFYVINKENSNCYLGADIHKDYRGLGYSKHMWNLMLDYSFNVLNLWRVGLTVAEYNPVALKTYKRVGFVEEGKMIQSLFRDNKYYDQLCMYMTRDMYGSIL